MMTKIHEEKTETRKVEVDRLCDFCGVSVYADSQYPEPDNYGNCSSTVDLRHSYQHGYSDGGNSWSLELDCCGKCFKDRVVPALVAAGLPAEKTGYTPSYW